MVTTEHSFDAKAAATRLFTNLHTASSNRETVFPGKVTINGILTDATITSPFNPDDSARLVVHPTGTLMHESRGGITKISAPVPEELQEGAIVTLFEDPRYQPYFAEQDRAALQQTAEQSTR